jgi:CYTH domain-containing protein
MVHQRQFLISPALARLVRRELGTQGRVQEGYFSSTPERTHFVRLDAPHNTLMMLMSGVDGEPVEEVTEVPASQARALLDVAPGQIAYDRTALAVAPGVEGVLKQILLPQPLHLLTLSCEDGASLDRLQVPLWTGPEVSGDASFSRAAIALQGAPEVGEIEISNAGLEVLLDLLQGRLSLRRAGAFEPGGASPYRRGLAPLPIADHLMAGLASALEDLEPTVEVPGDNSAVQTRPMPRALRQRSI